MGAFEARGLVATGLTDHTRRVITPRLFVGSFAARGGALKLAKRLVVRYPGASVELVQSSQ